MTVVMQAFPERRAFLGHRSKAPGASSTPGRPMSTISAAREDWGFAPRYDFARAFSEYLIPTIRKQYSKSTSAVNSLAHISGTAATAHSVRLLVDPLRRRGDVGSGVGPRIGAAAALERLMARTVMS